MTALVGNLLPLAPTVLALVGAITVCAFWRLILAGKPGACSGERILVFLAEGFLALALGSTVRLAIVSFKQPVQTYDPFGAFPRLSQGVAGRGALPFPAILGVTRTDSLALPATLLVILLAISTLTRAAASPRISVGVLLATAAALYASINPVPAALGLAWLALALVPMLDEESATTNADRRSTWLIRGVAGAAILCFADAALAVGPTGQALALLGGHPAPRGVPALLVILAATAAGIGPFGGAVRDLDHAPLGRFVGVVAFPIVGYLLVGRLLIENPGAPTLFLRGFLILLVLWSIGGAVVDRLARLEQLARLLMALAFLALTALSVPIAFFGFALLVAGIVAQLAGEAISRTTPTHSPLVLLPNLGLAEWLEDLAIPEAICDGVRDLAALLQQVEERYDLAVGLLLALAVVSAFAR